MKGGRGIKFCRKEESVLEGRKCVGRKELCGKEESVWEGRKCVGRKEMCGKKGVVMEEKKRVGRNEPLIKKEGNDRKEGSMGKGKISGKEGSV